MIVDGSETGSSFRQALYFKSIGFKLWQTLIYSKTSFSFPRNERYHSTFEYVFVLSKGKPKTFNPLMDRPNKYRISGGPSGRHKDGTRNTTKSGKAPRGEWGKRFSVWNFSIGGGHSYKQKVDHPAVMHQELCADLIKSWSNPGDLVFDPLAGAGTTLMCAKSLDRNYLAIDICEKY
jgi:site-specific DNA-methyltransferase (adenine-specific)